MTDVYGVQAVRAVLTRTPERARVFYYQQGRRDARVNELISLVKAQGVRFQAVDKRWLTERLGEAVHQGVVLDCHELELARETALFEALKSWTKPLLLVLDGVTDPRNFGACLRTANAAGVDAVIVPKRKSAPLSSVALKTAQGGAEGLMIVEVANLARTLERLKSERLWVIGADGQAAATVWELDATTGLALVVGSEGKGLRRLTKERCDQLVSIPMAGTVASLNVSVATGVLLFEAARQRSRGVAGPG